MTLNKSGDIVNKISSEKPGTKKKNFSLIKPANGEKAPDFSASNLNNNRVSLKEMMGDEATLIFFAKTSCPFTKDALPDLYKVYKKHEVNGVKCFIINQEESLKSIAAVYREKVPGVPVVWDEDGDISKEYGVDVTPYFFLLDNKRKIVKHRSFTAGAAENAINTLLGLEAEKTRYKSTEAG